MTEYLFHPNDSRDNCGVGLIVDRKSEATRDVILKTFEALSNLAHRGAVDADGKTGDGSGILTDIPRKFFIRKAREAGIEFSDKDSFAVMVVFYPRMKLERQDCRDLVREIFKKYNIEEMWARTVPVDENTLGQKAAKICPFIEQNFLKKPEGMTDEEFEKELFLIRKEIDIIASDRFYTDFYIPSISCRTIIYKGLFVGDEIKNFYLDLLEDDFISSFAIFHQRFSTNTFPAWKLAQPFRMLAHNGEINTIRANRNWMYARSVAEQPKIWVSGDHAIKRIILAGGSDSASFDNMLEAYVHGGRSILHSVIHMLPEAWQHNHLMEEDLKAFYEFHACLTEPWDGPAAVAFTDKKYIGAIVDRNGLRPARYKVTKDYFFVCSEMGCVYFPEETVEENGKLSPGKIIAYNFENKNILKDIEIKSDLAKRQPYKKWLDDNLYKTEDKVIEQDQPIVDVRNTLSLDELHTYQKAFGYTKEDIDLVIKPMLKTGAEPIGSMGDDTPLSALSDKPRLFYTYFKQLFAQVTNPPIDPIREDVVTSLRMYLGSSGNIFEETPVHAKQVRIKSPILTQSLFKDLISMKDFPAAVLTTQFKVKEGPECLDDTLLGLCMAAEHAIDDGKNFIVLSDRYIDKENAPIPMLLAVSAVHHHLIRVGKRLNISLLVETGEAREVHHFACLIGYGASAVYPFVALNTVTSIAEDENLDVEESITNYIKASEKGLLKVMSKMGISVLQSYHAAQVFEAIGVSNNVIKFHFRGTPSRISGASLKDIAQDYLYWHSKAYFQDEDNLEDMGFYRFRRSGEYHANHPVMIKHLHKAVNDNDLESYQKYADFVNQREAIALRDLLEIKNGHQIPLGKVEEAEAVVKRFCTPGISYGALSKETHEDFAIAMNRIGAKSNSGEGGEDPARFNILKNGDSKISAIKQVASGRFGVTIDYLHHANEIEIKMAQGAKPGEGGQLPGHKVSQDIARVRHSTPGVTLISPPPHHDIYSIEDLAQLIYDLKQVNPKARVCVKLVSESGVGTIAAGVVKAFADVILISGHDGGTGASPLSSIKNVGLPWELGLAEVQQVLVFNNLRSRVTLRVDGGFKTGLDVVKAALLGAQEFGFGTLSMLAMGCVMVRQCHKNTCPVGIATQREDLRKKYKGDPEKLIRLFHFIAEEVREILSQIGANSLEDITGRMDLLKQIDKNLRHGINLKPLITLPMNPRSPLTSVVDRNERLNDENFDEHVLQYVHDSLINPQGVLSFNFPVKNIHRSVGTKLSYYIVKYHGADGLPGSKLTLNLNGTIGQSFGAFAVKSLELNLEGEANDYVGKGLSGARITVKPPKVSQFKAEENIICGNTCLYGATSGELFVNGRAGERYAVRNSGANTVVEGIGDHGCEYMTGGRVLVLGSIGYNFGAGMTGGMALIYSPDQDLSQYINPNSVQVFSADWSENEMKEFHSLLEKHVKLTGSQYAGNILKNWESIKSDFYFVVPIETLKAMKKTA